MNKDVMNNEFYNAFADSFDKIPFEDVLIPLVVKYLPENNCEILEIGSGAGAWALWLVQHGHNVICVEPAEKPAEKAREKGLNVFLTRFQDFSSDQEFDGIFAISSLIHISRLEMPLQIHKMSKLLRHEGIAFVSFIEGNDESVEDPTLKGKNRFFSKFTHDELSALLAPYFSVIEMHQIEVRKMNQSFFLIVLKRL